MPWVGKRWHSPKRSIIALSGTVEFIVDSQRHFYFLEMNTRLQVEHPVTEYTTGIDLVEQMIRIAAGLAAGSAAERYSTQWLGARSTCIRRGSSAQFFTLDRPLNVTISHPLRAIVCAVDTGVQEGSEISVHYDAMIAKVISYGKTREQAIATMAECT